MSNKTMPLTDELYDYLLETSLREPELLKRLREETMMMDSSSCQISPEQGQFMALLVRLLGARRTIEVGVYTGYSSLVIALALPEDGRMIACDIDDEWTSTARRYWSKAGVAHKIDLRLQPAEQTLQELLEQGKAGSFDFAFIDADKTGYDRYYELCLELVRPGGLIALDNMFSGGRVTDGALQDDNIRAIRELNRKLHADMRIDLSLVPIADGLALARKRGPGESGR